MPHLTLEYTRNLSGFEPAPALAAINHAMLDSGLFGEPDIKSRAQALDCYQVGIQALPRGFVHVRIALLAGRSAKMAQKFSSVLKPPISTARVTPRR